MARKMRFLALTFATCLFSLLLTPTTPAMADSVLLTTLSQPCDITTTFIRGNVRQAFKFHSPASTVISSAQFKFYDATYSSGTNAYIYADNSNSLSTLIGTLNWASYDSVSQLSSFTGSITLPSAGNYWVEIFNNGGNAFPCVTSSSSYTGSATGWNTIVGSVTYPPTTTAYSGSGWWVMSLSGPAPATISLALDSGTTSTAFRTVSGSRIKATLSTDGTVKFFANGKVIPGCQRVASSGSIAYCNWKPSKHGNNLLLATITPSSSSYTAATSTALSVGAVIRSGNR